MPKITYLLGAGASAGLNGLPLVKAIPEKNIEGMPEAFLRVKKQLKDYKFGRVDENNASYLIDGLEWLADRSREFGTVDTFAKYCYLKGIEDLVKLKFILGAYFMIDQVVNKKVDKRYQVFLTTLLRKLNTFPSNVKILNWNYDFQFQLACRQFGRVLVTPDSPGLRRDPMIKYFPNVGNTTYPNGILPKDFDVVHLNGIAGFYVSEQLTVQNNIIFENFSLEEILIYLRDLRDAVDKHLITFAFEEENKHKSLRSAAGYAQEMVRGSSVLVIIGYSFPFFNREVDSLIFETLKESPSLKIYYQDPDPERDVKFLYSQFDLKEIVKINHIKNVSQLYLPYEL